MPAKDVERSFCSTLQFLFFTVAWVKSIFKNRQKYNTALRARNIASKVS